MDLEVQEAKPVVALEWVLLDFGRRKSGVVAAKNQLLAANLGFNARHQAIVVKVQSAFYELSKIRGRIDVAQSALASALKVQEAAETRFAQGLTTAPDVSLARQQATSAEFDYPACRATWTGCVWRNAFPCGCKWQIPTTTFASARRRW